MNTKIFFAVAFNAVLILAAASSDNFRPYKPVDILQSGNEVVPEIHSELECKKCQGWESCTNEDGSPFNKEKIGCGSCNYDGACKNLGADVTIGENSCNGESSCVRSKGKFNLNKRINFG